MSAVCVFLHVFDTYFLVYTLALLVLFLFGVSHEKVTKFSLYLGSFKLLLNLLSFRKVNIYLGLVYTLVLVLAYRGDLTLAPAKVLYKKVA